MIKSVCCIKDCKVGFMSPIVRENENVAIRDFSIMVNGDKDNMLSVCPNDFELYLLGTFDTNSGLLVSLETPKFLCRASDVKEVGANNG